MIRIYRLFLRLYPADHRREFGDEMAAVFGGLKADATQQGVIAHARLCVREGSGLVLGAVQEHWREFSSRRSSMRTEFRFPKATWVLMTIILAGVALAIEKGEAISAMYSRVNPVAGPSYQPGHHALLSGIAESFLVIYGLGLLAWAILLAMRRFGAHRLDEISSPK